MHNEPNQNRCDENDDVCACVTRPAPSPAAPPEYNKLSQAYLAATWDLLVHKRTLVARQAGMQYIILAGSDSPPQCRLLTFSPRGLSKVPTVRRPAGGRLARSPGRLLTAARASAGSRKRRSAAGSRSLPTAAAAAPRLIRRPPPRRDAPHRSTHDCRGGRRRCCPGWRPRRRRPGCRASRRARRKLRQQRKHRRTG